MQLLKLVWAFGASLAFCLPGFAQVGGDGNIAFDPTPPASLQREIEDIRTAVFQSESLRRQYFQQIELLLRQTKLEPMSHLVDALIEERDENVQGFLESMERNSDFYQEFYSHLGERIRENPHLVNKIEGFVQSMNNHYKNQRLPVPNVGERIMEHGMVMLTGVALMWSMNPGQGLAFPAEIHRTVFYGLLTYVGLAGLGETVNIRNVLAKLPELFKQRLRLQTRLSGLRKALSSLKNSPEIQDELFKVYHFSQKKSRQILMEELPHVVELYKGAAERLAESEGFRARLAASNELRQMTRLLKSANEILTEEEKAEVLSALGDVPEDLPLKVSYKLLEFQNRIRREIARWVSSLDENSVQSLLSVMHRDLANHRLRFVKSTSIHIPHSIFIQTLNIVTLAASAYLAFGFQPEVLDYLPFGFIPEAYRNSYPVFIKALGLGVVGTYGNMVLRTLKDLRRNRTFKETATQVNADLYREIFKVLTLDEETWLGYQNASSNQTMNPRDLIKALQEEYESYQSGEAAPLPGLKCNSLLTSQ